MKNICFLIGDMSLSGGTERVTSIIANELAKEHYQVSILSLSNGEDSFFKLDKSIALHSLYSKKVSMKKNFIGCCYKIRKFVQHYKIDSLIVVDSICCVFTVPALWGLKVNHICWEHFNFNVNLGIKFRDIGRQLAAKYCDYVVTLTNRDKVLWEAGLKRINAQIINIANPTPYENIENVPSLEYKTILAMGRLTHQKGFDILIDAWGGVCKENKDWILRIVGSGENEEYLKDKVKLLNIRHRVEFVPATKNVEKYFKTSSFFCLSSRFEGFGMVILEAMSFSIPVVSFNCDCGPSDLIVNNETGILVDNMDVDALKCSLLRVMGFSQENYISFSEKTAIKVKDFYLDKILSSWIEII
ncbi:glycosyltransferase family 4 protein [Acinetobacter johnsonii]|uniref:glycosyltransferase family 4 protein n=1 Tax=Acinetobacter johnsonii TaxID=40214 RepID=UPI00073D2055|nr:glycosyltransferase family 4 protein [Acinetobacter johnsonii]ALV74311.1 hypothetical protein RZ95_16580 [Acinetobacter johnsonii XBB1]